MNERPSHPDADDSPYQDPIPSDDKTLTDASHTMPLSRRTVFNSFEVEQRAHLRVIGLAEGEKNVELDPESTIELGRGSECGIRLVLPGVSRCHARVFHANDEYHLEDLNSTNGSFVNGVRVSRCVLRNNDVIEIGEAKIHFVEKQVSE